MSDERGNRGKGRKHKRERTSTIAYVIEPALEIVLVIVAIVFIIMIIPYEHFMNLNYSSGWGNESLNCN